MVTRTYVEEIEDPVTGQLQVFEAATEAELEQVVANAFPQNEAGHLDSVGDASQPRTAPGDS
ncbi:hypothetical protein GCM10009616_34970 [Microlunatus lacustris]